MSIFENHLKKAAYIGGFVPSEKIYTLGGKLHEKLINLLSEAKRDIEFKKKSDLPNDRDIPPFNSRHFEKRIEILETLLLERETIDRKLRSDFLVQSLVLDYSEQAYKRKYNIQKKAKGLKNPDRLWAEYEDLEDGYFEIYIRDTNAFCLHVDQVCETIIDEYFQILKN